ncbi:hypothetical protein SNEBB_010505 [Seison nebaliae]|nr:hypothetical protein SNEBB_010505 [Seison nebaliae]
MQVYPSQNDNGTYGDGFGDRNPNDFYITDELGQKNNDNPKNKVELRSTSVPNKLLSLFSNKFKWILLGIGVVVLIIGAIVVLAVIFSPKKTCESEPTGYEDFKYAGTCGNAITRIINGAPSADQSQPWLAAVITTRGGSSFLCGGAIINRYTIISAAHCFYPLDGISAIVRVGNNDRTASPSLSVDKILNHACYNDKTHKHDIAILQLRSALTFSDDIKPICLPTQSDNASPGTTLTVAGWGKTESGSITSTLREVNVQVQDVSTCDNAFNTDVDSDDQICAGNSVGIPKDSCQGDSGGPLMKKDIRKHILLGVVSYGDSGCRGKGVYTKYTESVPSKVSSIRKSIRASTVKVSDEQNVEFIFKSEKGKIKGDMKIVTDDSEDVVNDGTTNENVPIESNPNNKLTENENQNNSESKINTASTISVVKDEDETSPLVEVVPKKNIKENLIALLSHLGITDYGFSHTEESIMCIEFLVEEVFWPGVLETLKNAGFGIIQNTRVVVIPTSYILQQNELPKINGIGNTQEEEDNEKTSGRNKFISTIANRMIVGDIGAAIAEKAEFDFDYVIYTVVASIMALIGLMENSSVLLVASMLVSPLMGPLLGLVFGIHIRDKQLIVLGIKSELYGLAICIIVGFALGVLYIFVTHTSLTSTGRFPTNEMWSRGDIRALMTGSLIGLVSGIAVAVSTLSGQVSSLVGVAISASLLPPVVNTGALLSFSLLQAYWVPYKLTDDSDIITSVLDEQGLMFQNFKKNCSQYDLNSYQPIYSCRLEIEALYLAAYSFLLAILNIGGILISSLSFFKLKESTQFNFDKDWKRAFFTTYVKEARGRRNAVSDIRIELAHNSIDEEELNEAFKQAEIFTLRHLHQPMSRIYLTDYYDRNPAEKGRYNGKKRRRNMPKKRTSGHTFSNRKISTMSNNSHRSNR